MKALVLLHISDILGMLSPKVVSGSFSNLTFSGDSVCFDLGILVKVVEGLESRSLKAP